MYIYMYMHVCTCPFYKRIPLQNVSMLKAEKRERERERKKVVTRSVCHIAAVVTALMKFSFQLNKCKRER